MLCASVFVGIVTLLTGQVRPPVSKIDSSKLDGKVLLGYQGWFSCPTRSAPGDKWSHWSRGVPSASTLTIDMYPDLRKFDAEELCEVPGMTIGDKPAYLFSSANSKTVDHHFR